MSLDATSVVYGALSVIIWMTWIVPLVVSVVGSVTLNVVVPVGMRSARMMLPEPPGSGMPVRFSVGYPAGTPAASPGGMRKVSPLGFHDTRIQPGCGMYSSSTRGTTAPGR